MGLLSVDIVVEVWENIIARPTEAQTELCTFFVGDFQSCTQNICSLTLR